MLLAEQYVRRLGRDARGSQQPAQFDAVVLHPMPVRPTARDLGLDLVVGDDSLLFEVDQEHALWDYLTGTGIDASEILWFRDNACPPDIIGFALILAAAGVLLTPNARSSDTAPIEQ